jgi:hypothetical protein
MKGKTTKWLLQFFGGSLLPFLTWRCLLYLPPSLVGYSHGMFAIVAGLCLPLTATVGVALGDIFLNRGKKLNIRAVAISFAWALAGEFTGFFILSLFPYLSTVGGIISFIFVPMIILSLISYNIVMGKKCEVTHEAEK